MTINMYATSFDAVDAAGVAAFGAEAFGREVNPGASKESAALVVRDGSGATDLATFPRWTTLADPDGNEFDLIRG